MWRHWACPLGCHTDSLTRYDMIWYHMISPVYCNLSCANAKWISVSVPSDVSLLWEDLTVRTRLQESLGVAFNWERSTWQLHPDPCFVCRYFFIQHHRVRCVVAACKHHRSQWSLTCEEACVWFLRDVRVRFELSAPTNYLQWVYWLTSACRGLSRTDGLCSKAVTTRPTVQRARHFVE